MRQWYFLFLLVCAYAINLSAQSQVIGSFPTMDGGFEGQSFTTATVFSATPTTVYTVSNANAVLTRQTATPRTGNNYASFSVSSNSAYSGYSPSITGVTSAGTYVVQFYYKTASATNRTINMGLSCTGTTFGADASGTTNNTSTWTKRTYAVTAGTGTTGNGMLKLRLNSSTSAAQQYYFDDMVVYAGTASDDVAPDPATSPSATVASSTSILVSWSAPSAGVDGGGYMVVRGTSDPNTTPNVNGIYGVGRTVAAGQTVVYLGATNSFTDTALTNGTTYYYRVYTVDKAFNYSTAVSCNALLASGTPPTVTTAAITDITFGTASSGGEVTSEGTASVTARGVCWNTSTNPTTANSKTTDGTGSGTFTSSLTGLLGGTTYYVRAYATSTAGTSYGSEVSFTTGAAVVPTVSTAAITSIGATLATSGGTVSSDGGASVTARGVCWSTSASPTISDSHTSNGTGTGSFSSSLTGLTAGTLYYVRAYATNSAGTNYGGDSSFTTSAPTVPIVTTNATTSITATSASSGGNVSTDGGASVTDRGVCWSTSANPTIADGKTSDGTGTGSFTSAITGLNQLTTYHVRAFATNSVGTGYGPDSTFTTAALTTYYNKASSDISLLSNWGSNSDGTGTNPVNFSVSGITFNIFNANPTLEANWSVSGTGSRVVVGGSTALSLTVPAGDTINLATGTSLTVAASCSLIVSGTVINQSSTAVTLTGNLTVANGGLYEHAVNGGTIPSATWSTGSNCKITGIIGTAGADYTALQGVNQTFYNFIVDCQSLVGKLIIAYNGGSFAVAGTLTINSTSSSTAQITRSTTQNTVNVGNYVQNAGNVFIIHNASSTGNRTLNVAGNFTLNNSATFTIVNGQAAAATTLFGILNVGGNVSVASGATLKNDQYGIGTLAFNGASAQTATFGITSPTYPLNVTMNNTSGGVALGSDLTMNGILTLTSGNLDIGNHNVILGSTATISGTPSSSSMVIATGTGEVRKSIASVPASFTFPVGTGSTYSPAKLTLSSGSLSSAYIGVKVAASKSSHNTSASNYINRTWTLTGSGITSPVYSDTLTYAAGDVAGTEGSLVGGLYNGAAWINLGAVDATNHYVMGSGLTSFGEMTAGEAGAFSSGGNVVATVIPQGYYNSGDYLNARDTVILYLANASSPYAIVDTAIVVLDSLTFSATGTFTTATTGSYYLVVKQRTCVETWSASTISFAQGSSVAYDFTDAQNKAYGDNQVEVNTSPSRWAIYGGDSNQDGYVDPLDLSLIDQDSFNYVSGAGLVTDVNGDHFVDPLDMSIADQNSFNYVGIKRPVAAKTINTRIRPQLEVLHYKGTLKTQK